MNTKLFALALAGTAGIAAAGLQSVTLHFDADGDPFGGEVVTAGIGDTVSWTVWASFDGYTDSSAYFGGFVGDFDANNPGGGMVSNIQVLMAGNATTPTANGASIEGINMFHSALLGTDDQSNPLMIMTFDTLITSAEGFNYQSDGTSSMFADDGIFSLPDEYTSVGIISDSVVVPAPAALSMLGLAGLAATRRRR